MKNDEKWRQVNSQEATIKNGKEVSSSDNAKVILYHICEIKNSIITVQIMFALIHDTVMHQLHHKMLTM